MWFFFYNGRVGFASNNIWTRDELVTEITASFERCSKGQFLPEDFSFHYSENELLTRYTRADLSLRG